MRAASCDPPPHRIRPDSRSCANGCAQSRPRLQSGRCHAAAAAGRRAPDREGMQPSVPVQYVAMQLESPRPARGGGGAAARGLASNGTMPARCMRSASAAAARAAGGGARAARTRDRAASAISRPRMSHSDRRSRRAETSRAPRRITSARSASIRQPAGRGGPRVDVGRAAATTPRRSSSRAAVLAAEPNYPPAAIVAAEAEIALGEARAGRDAHARALGRSARSTPSSVRSRSSVLADALDRAAAQRRKRSPRTSNRTTCAARTTRPTFGGQGTLALHARAARVARAQPRRDLITVVPPEAIESPGQRSRIPDRLSALGHDAARAGSRGSSARHGARGTRNADRLGARVHATRRAISRGSARERMRSSRRCARPIGVASRRPA